MKKNASLQTSDYAVAFLNTFNELYPKTITSEKDAMKKQNKLMRFILTVENLIKSGIFEDKYFRAALVTMAIFILRIGIESEDTVEISVFSM